MPFQDLLGQSEGALGAQPAPHPAALGIAETPAVPGCGIKCCLAGIFPCILGQHGLEQDAGQQAVLALRDADVNVNGSWLVHLGGTTDPLQGR